jgi:hypothetical protein
LDPGLRVQKHEVAATAGHFMRLRLILGRAPIGGFSKKLFEFFDCLSEKRSWHRRLILICGYFLPPFQGLNPFCSLTQGGRSQTRSTLGFSLLGFQPFQFEPRYLGYYGLTSFSAFAFSASFPVSLLPAAGVALTGELTLRSVSFPARGLQAWLDPNIQRRFLGKVVRA